MPKKRQLENEPVFYTNGQLAGYVDGVLHAEPNNGEVVFEEDGEIRGIVGGGNPIYSKNYEKLDWNN